MKKFTQGRIFVALDMSQRREAMDMAVNIAPHCAGFKIGLEFFMKFGPDSVLELGSQARKPIFLDLKFHDIPNTVAGAVKSVSRLQPALLTLHASGGSAMLKAAKEAALEEADKAGIVPPVLLAVTLLTSLEQSDLAEIGYLAKAGDQVLRLSELALQAGMDGLVCSGEELNLLRKNFGAGPTLAVPGIRMQNHESGDQKRVMNPKEAVEHGADILVIGRPVTKAADPAAAVKAISSSIKARA